MKADQAFLVRRAFFLEAFFLEAFFLEAFFLEAFFLEAFFLEAFFLLTFFLEAFFFEAFFLEAFFLAVFLAVFLAAMFSCLLRTQGAQHMTYTQGMLHDVYCHLLRCVNVKSASGFYEIACFGLSSSANSSYGAHV